MELSPWFERQNNRGKRPTSVTKTVLEVITLIKDGKVQNPMFQRNQGWEIFPKNKSSSYYEYIEFLYETCHSFSSFSWAKYTDAQGNEYFVNIDGNNRMAALIYFYDHPLVLFSRKNSDDDKFHNFGYFRASPTVFKDMLEFLESVNLLQLMTMTMRSFRRDHAELFKSLTEDEREYFEDELERTQHNLKTTDHSGNLVEFYKEVLVSINILDKPNLDELADIYHKINGKNNPMSASDIAASTLMTANQFRLSFDPVFETTLRLTLDQYYADKCIGERVQRQSWTTKREFNGFEFLVGFQDYCSRQFTLVPKFLDEINGKNKNNKGYSLFLKLFDFFFGLVPQQFTTENVETYTRKIRDALTVLQNVLDHAFPATLKFALNAKSKYKKDVMFVLIIVTCKLMENVTATVRDHMLRKVLIYHYCVETSKLSREVKAAFKVCDDLRYQSGGDTIRLKAQAFQRNPCEFGLYVTRDKLRDLFLAMIQAHNENAAACLDKGSVRVALPDGILLMMSIYFHSNVPYYKHGKEEKNCDHIAPASTRCPAEKVVLSRVGNYMIFGASLNKARRNKSIQFYYDKEPQLMQCLHYPSVEDYDAMVYYEENNPVLRDAEKFQRFAEWLESVYVDEAIKYVFP